LISAFGGLFGLIFGVLAIIGDVINERLFIGRLVRHMYLMKKKNVNRSTNEGFDN